MEANAVLLNALLDHTEWNSGFFANKVKIFGSNISFISKNIKLKVKDVNCKQSLRIMFSQMKKPYIPKSEANKGMCIGNLKFSPLSRKLLTLVYASKTCEGGSNLHFFILYTYGDNFVFFSHRNASNQLHLGIRTKPLHFALKHTTESLMYFRSYGYTILCIITCEVNMPICWTIMYGKYDNTKCSWNTYM